MEQVTVRCVSTGVDRRADVLKRSMWNLRVVFEGTTTPLDLSRRATRQPYVGRLAGMEFAVYALVGNKVAPYGKPVPGNAKIRLTLINTLEHNIARAKSCLVLGHADAAEKHFRDAAAIAKTLADMVADRD